jgi:hypothetical protein
MTKPRLETDGNNFNTLEEFDEEFHRNVLGWTDPRIRYGYSLDAFNDVLRGGFGTPEGGFVLCWKNHEVSRERLGYPETVRQLTETLSHCHSSNIPRFTARLEDAKRGVGPTVFDWLVEIIRDHGPGGTEEEDGVELFLL